MALTLFTIAEPDGDEQNVPINLVAGASYPPVQVVFGDPVTDEARFVTDADPLPVTGEFSIDSITLAALELIGIKGADGTLIAGNTNPFPISDAGGSLTVDGTVAATQGTSPWVVSGTVALDSGTLTALEMIGVKGEDGSTIVGPTNPLPTGLPGYDDPGNRADATLDAYAGTKWIDESLILFGVYYGLTVASLGTPGDTYIGTAFECTDFAGFGISASSNRLGRGYAIWEDAAGKILQIETTAFIGAGSFFDVPGGAVKGRIAFQNRDTTGAASFKSNIVWKRQATGLFMFPAAGVIDGTFLAALVKAIPTGQQPDGDYNNAKFPGLAFSTSETLDADEIFVSDWHDTDGWPSLLLFAKTDREGDVLVQFTDDTGSSRTVTDGVANIGSPALTSATAAFVDPDDLHRAVTVTGFSADAQIVAVVSATEATLSSDATASGTGLTVELGPVIQHEKTYQYTQREIDAGFLSRPIFSELDGFRVVYRNNEIAAQGEFYLSVNLHVTQVGPPVATLGTSLTQVDDVTTTKGALIAPDAADSFETIGRDGEGASLNSHVTAIDDDILLEPLPAPQIRQFQIGNTPVFLDSTKKAGRRAVKIVNHDDTDYLYVGFSDSIASDSGTEQVSPLGFTGGMYDDTVDIYAVTTAGGTQNTLTRSGSTNSGTAGSTANALTSDDTYATVSAAGQTISLGTFTAGTTSVLVSVRLGIEAKKDSGQTETSALDGSGSGRTTGSGTITSDGNITGGANKHVVVAISRNALNTVNAVSAGGVALARIGSVVDTGGRRLETWWAYGTFTASGVTASMSTSTNGHLAWFQISNGSTTATPLVSTGATGTGAAVTATGVSGTNKGFAIMAVSHESASGTAGAGYTERTDETNGAGSNTDSLYTETKPLVSTGTEAGTATLNASSDWSTLVVTIEPRDAIDPTVTLSYELSAVPGATSGTITLSSASDTSQYVDITGDRTWVFGDIANVQWIATGLSISAANALVDHGFIELADSTGTTVRCSLVEI